MDIGCAKRQKNYIIILNYSNTISSICICVVTVLICCFEGTVNENGSFTALFMVP
jgi:hypothetical protein